MSLLKLVEANDIEKVIQFVKNNKIKEGDDIWSLFEAVNNGSIEIVKILIDAGVNVNNERLMGQPNNIILIEGTVLREAVLESHTDIIKLLLKAGADVNRVLNNPDEPSALMLAAQQGYLEIVKILVDAGADVNMIREGNTYALLSSASNGYKDVFNYLYPLTNSELRQFALEVLPKGIQMREMEENADPDIVELTSAIVKGNIERVREIIDKGININEFDDVGCTSLLVAAIVNNFQITKMLLEAGADPNIKDFETNETPLIRTKCKEISSLLIEAGADVNAKTLDGTTNLMKKVSAFWHLYSLDIIKLLIKAGADLNAKDNKGNTALSIAKLQGNFEVVQLLLNAGAAE